MEEVLRCTSLVPLACVPLFCTLFNRAGSRRVFRLPGAGRDHFHCTVEPSSGHIRCRFVRSFPGNEAYRLFPMAQSKVFWVGSKKFMLKKFMYLFLALKNRNCLQWGRSNLVDPAEWPNIGLINRDFGNILWVFPRKTQSSLKWFQSGPRKFTKSYFSQQDTTEYLNQRGT